MKLKSYCKNTKTMIFFCMNSYFCLKYDKLFMYDLKRRCNFPDCQKCGNCSLRKKKENNKIINSIVVNGKFNTQHIK